MDKRQGVHHFWSPPDPTERIVSTCQHRGLLVIATDSALYIATPHGEPLPDWDLRKIVADLRGS